MFSPLTASTCFFGLNPSDTFYISRNDPAECLNANDFERNFVGYIFVQFKLSLKQVCIFVFKCKYHLFL